jgi:hypothetical protein
MLTIFFNFILRLLITSFFYAFYENVIFVLILYVLVIIIRLFKHKVFFYNIDLRSEATTTNIKISL